MKQLIATKQESYHLIKQIVHAKLLRKFPSVYTYPASQSEYVKYFFMILKLILKKKKIIS